MRVRIIGLGTNWWAAHSRDLNDPFCFRRNAAWFNSAGLKYGRRLRMCWAFPGQIRFNLTSNFDPDRPLRSIGRTFECSGPNFFDGRIHLLFRLPANNNAPDRFLVTLNERTHGHISFATSAWRSDWRSAHLGQCARRPVRSDGADRRHGLGRNRDRQVDSVGGWQTD